MKINMMNTMILSKVGFCHWFDDQSIRGMFNILLPEVNIFLERYLILQHAFGRKSVSLPKLFIFTTNVDQFSSTSWISVKSNNPFVKSEFFTSQHKFPYLISRSIIYGHKSKRTPQEQRKEPKSGRSLRFIEFRVLHFFTFLLLSYWFHFIPISAREGASKSWWRKQKPSRYRELLGSLRCCISYLASQKWVQFCFARTYFCTKKSTLSL